MGGLVSNTKHYVPSLIIILILIIIMSGRMTGEFRAKLWAHSARDWAINSRECGALIMIIFTYIFFEIGILRARSRGPDYDERHCSQDLKIEIMNQEVFLVSYKGRSNNYEKLYLKVIMPPCEFNKTSEYFFGDLDDKDAPRAQDWSIKNPQ